MLHQKERSQWGKCNSYMVFNELLSTKVTRSSRLMLDLKLPNENLTTTGRVAKRKRVQTNMTKDTLKKQTTLI
jgi:hypothetical protein